MRISWSFTNKTELLKINGRLFGSIQVMFNSWLNVDKEFYFLEAFSIDLKNNFYKISILHAVLLFLIYLHLNFLYFLSELFFKAIFFKFPRDTNFYYKLRITFHNSIKKFFILFASWLPLWIQMLCVSLQIGRMKRRKTSMIIQI